MCRAEPIQITVAQADPSFPCKSPTPIEAVICSDEKLASRDRTMAFLFAASRTDALGSGVSGEYIRQRLWLHDRNEKCAKGPELKCLVDAYDNRLFDLAVATLFTAHDAAMTELSRQNPKAAQIYEAIFQYATTDDPAARAKRVGAFISNAFAAMRSAGDPISILNHDIPDLATAASSDKAFSAVIDFLSLEDYFGRGGPLTFPCTALVKRPGLMDVLEPIFGSSMDVRISVSDCAATLPPIPSFDTLAKEAEIAQTPCDGTIVFADEREYWAMVAAIRLHRPTYWEKKHTIGSVASAASPPVGVTDTPSDSGESRFRRLHRDLIDGAAIELTNYYVANFRAAYQLADNQARDAINAVITTAYNFCQ
jgi:uncharacterized protein